MNKLPKMVTSHNGIDAQKPASSTADSIADGKETEALPTPPKLPAISVTTPPQMVYNVVIKSIA